MEKFKLSTFAILFFFSLSQLRRTFIWGYFQKRCHKNFSRHFSWHTRHKFSSEKKRKHVKHSLRKPQVALLVTFWNADWCLTASNAKSSSGINYNDFDASFWLDLYPMLIISWNVNRASKKKSHFPSVNNGWGWMNTWKAIFESGSSSLPKKIVAEIGNSNESDVWWCRREGWDDTYCEDVGNWREYVILFQMQITIDVFHRKCVNKSPIETYFLGYMRGEADGILIA